MAHGLPDYGPNTPKSTTYGLADLAELAARLGSIVTFDRRGDVVWLDDFEDNLAKWELGFGTGTAVLSAATARNGGKSAKLTTPAVTDLGATITKRLPFPALSKIGSEISVAQDDSNILFLSGAIFFLLGDGTFKYGQWEYLPLTTTLNIFDHTAGTVSLSTSVQFADSIYLFHTFKLVVDLVTGKYVRLIMDETEWDLSAYTLIGDDADGDAWMYSDFRVATKAAVAASCYVDDAIVTQNEP